ncbi:hypothetical protein [Ferrovibrio terrae]|uniref:hypothetical protein n=1 Tax=Ferrovibrio terrae TaxID=2594003 RepID=UPI003137BB64
MTTGCSGSSDERDALKDFGARFKAAFDHRVSLAGLDQKDVAAAIKKHPSTLRAHRAGENPMSYLDLEAYDDYFAAIGQPGLIDDVRQQRNWTAYAEQLQSVSEYGPAQRLMECAPGLRSAGGAIEEFLAEQGLLPYVHIMVAADGAVRTSAIGSKMPTARALDPSIKMRDVRNLSDRAYGQFLHRQVHELLQDGRDVVQHISAPSMSYYRLGVPVGNFLVAVTFGAQVIPSYKLG